MQRFLVNSDLQDKIIITDKDFIHQISKVLRSKIWDEIILFNADINTDIIYKIEKISSKNIELIKLKHVEKKENNFKLNLFSALPNKLSKVELILQKCTEIWVNSITFFTSERSQKLIISDNKKSRLENIIKEATEQSYRNSYLKLNFTDNNNLDLKNLWEFYFLHTQDINSKHISEIKNSSEINLLIWPEWWFSSSEVEEFKKLWWNAIYLWWNILRTETASITTSFYIIQNNLK